MGNVLCCIKRRENEEDNHTSEKSKAEKKNKERAYSSGRRERDESRKKGVRSNKNKTSTKISDKGNNNIINGDFDTFNVQSPEKPKSSANNKDKKNLDNIREEDETENDTINNDFSQSPKKSNSKFKKINETETLDNLAITESQQTQSKKSNKQIATNANSTIKFRQSDKKLLDKEITSNKNINNNDEENIVYELGKKKMAIISNKEFDDSQSIEKNKLTIGAEYNNKEATEKSKNDQGLNSIKKNFKKANYRLEIFIECFNLQGLDTDNFGPHFLPYLEICLDDNNAEKINLYNNLDNSKLDNSNNSNISDLDISCNMNQSYVNQHKINKSKTFLCNFNKNYLISNENFYAKDSNLMIALKNGLMLKKNDNVNNVNIPIITIGWESINLGKFYRTYKEAIFDGCLELKLRKSSVIGSVNICMLITEEKGSSFEIDLDQQTKKFEDYIIPKKSMDILDDNISQKSANRYGLLWRNNLIDSDELTNDITNDFFLNNVEDEALANIKNCFVKSYAKEYANDSNKILNSSNNESENKNILYNQETNQVINEETLRNLFIFECIKKKNKFALYQLYYIILNFISYEQYEIIDKFFSLLDDSQLTFFLELNKQDDKNIFLYKYYLLIMDNYILYHKNNQVIYCYL